MGDESLNRLSERVSIGRTVFLGNTLCGTNTDSLDNVKIRHYQQAYLKFINYPSE